METDHISEKAISDAYQAGWDAYPGRKPSGYKELILIQAYEQGYEDHLKEPSPVSFSI
jgi:hypothetical protein